MNKRKLLAATVALATSLAFAQDEKCPVNANVRGHENVEWSISYAYHLTDTNSVLPRVLLVGDSICNGYQNGVQELLEGRMNVSYWISSYCVTSPGYLKLLDFYLSEAKYDVVHFNNGLHSLSTPVAAYERGIEAALKLIRERQPKARIVWTTSTPLANPALTEKARLLNEAAAKVVARLGGIGTDDLFALLDPLDRKQHWSDVYHHRSEARDLEARQVARSILPGTGIGL